MNALNSLIYNVELYSRGVDYTEWSTVGAGIYREA